MIKSSLNSYFSPLNSQKGQSTVYIIIFVIVIIFAVMLSGGGDSLFSGNEPSSVTETPGTATDQSPTASSSAGWDITIALDSGCQQGKSPYKTGSITVKGTEKGYLQLSFDDNGTPKDFPASSFIPPDGTFSLNLTNDDGFNTRKWKVTIYSGGIQSNGSWSGGTQKAVAIGEPTGCT